MDGQTSKKDLNKCETTQNHTQESLDAADGKIKPSCFTIPIELPIQIPSGVELDFSMRGSERCEDGKYRTMVHVQVNKSCQESQCSNFANYSIFDYSSLGYKDVSNALNDISCDLKQKEEKLLQGLKKQQEELPPKSNVQSKNSTINSCEEGDKLGHFREAQGVIPSISEDSLDYHFSNDLNLSNWSNALNASNVNLATEDPISQPSDHVASFKKVPVKKTRKDRKKHWNMNVSGYSFDLKKAKGLILKYDKEKGGSFVTADCPSGMKIVEPGEQAGLVVKIYPDRPVSLRVVKE